jgi:protein-tyrosine-phosphatase
MSKYKIKNILLVCTGNSCRSVMAAGYLTKRLKEIGKDISVRSAGTCALDGFSPTEETTEIMKEIGVDVSNHKAASLENRMIKEADVILVMEPSHRYAVLKAAPDKIDRVFYLRRFDAEAHEDIIPDPIGKGMPFYRDVLNVIKKSTEGFLKWMEN